MLSILLTAGDISIDYLIQVASFGFSTIKLLFFPFNTCLLRKRVRKSSPNSRGGRSKFQLLELWFCCFVF